MRPALGAAGGSGRDHDPVAYRHGLRVSELVALTWSQVDLEAGRLQVLRCKGSDNSVQPLSRVEIRALRKLRRDQEPRALRVYQRARGAPNRQWLL